MVIAALRSLFVLNLCLLKFCAQFSWNTGKLYSSGVGGGTDRLIGNSDNANDDS